MGDHQNGEEAPPEARSTTRRGTLFIAVYLLVLLWAGMAAMSWSGKLRDADRLPAPLALPLKCLGIAAAVTTWPAHEIRLAIAGRGFGANRRSDVGVGSALVFLVWCAILWSPLLALHWRRVPVWLGAVTQMAWLLLVFALFWKFGNG